MCCQKTAVIKIAETPTPFHVAQNIIIHTKYALSTVECYVLVSEYQTGINKRGHFIIPRWKAGRIIWENILKAFRFNIVSALKCICEGERWMNNTRFSAVFLITNIEYNLHIALSHRRTFQKMSKRWTASIQTVHLALNTPLSNFCLLIDAKLKFRN